MCVCIAKFGEIISKIVNSKYKKCNTHGCICCVAHTCVDAIQHILIIAYQPSGQLDFYYWQATANDRTIGFCRGLVYVVVQLPLVLQQG